MKTPSPLRSSAPARVCGLGALVVFFASLIAHAGLTLEMNVIRYHQYGYYFFPNLTTNTTPANVTFGDYFITSFGYPTNGSSSLYHFDANGFNQVSGGSSGYGDFDGMIHELTNSLWSIYVTNTVTTNVYHFKVTANIKTNDLPLVSITFPADGAVNVTNRPTFAWRGPTNYNGLVAYYFNSSSILPVAQTNLLSPIVLYQGLNSFTAHYDSNSTTAVVSSVPTNNAGPAISSWVSTAHLQDYISSQFAVGTVDTSGTSHSLVAHYPWDGTNANGSASGVDTSGNGYHMNFGGSFGSQGGTNSTTDPAAGPRAIQFHNGDGNSAGYVGWNPTPAPLLTALSGSFTISCWIRTTQNNFGWDQAPAFYGAGIVSADNGGLANDVVPLALTGSKIGFNTGGSSEDVTLNSSAAVNDGNYHHVVVTRNQPTGQKIIYIDGVLDSFSSGTTNVLSDPQKLTLGALADASDPDPNNFNYYNGYDGKLDDLQIYSGVLSSNEVANLFANPGATAANSGVPSGGHQNVAHYAFEDGTSTFQLGVDSSPNGNNLSGYSYWGQVHTNSTASIAGTNAVQFFGTSSINANGQVRTNLNAVLAGSFSFSAWVKTTASRGNNSDNAYFGATIFWAYNDHNNTNDTIPLAITGSKAAFTTRGGNSGASDTLHSTTSVNDGNYHLITVTRDQSTGEKKIYVDGNFEDSEIGTTNPLNGNDYYLSVGGSVLSSYTGILDDVQVYSGVLSSGDVAYLYANPGSLVPDIANTSPSLTVTASPLIGPLPLTVQFTSPGVDSGGNTVTNWNWNFGDGATSTAQSPSHTYTNFGSFSPSLVAYSTYGSSPLSVTGPGTITVTNHTLNVTDSPQSGPFPLTVQFSSPGVDSGGNTVTNWSWTFGDGGTSTAQNPSHTYTTANTFFPSLVARSTYNSMPLDITGPGAITVTNIPNPNFQILHSFTATSGSSSTNGDGSGPNGGLVLIGNNLYGTTQRGGTNAYGALFKVQTDGSGFTNVYNFSYTNGALPVDGVILSGNTFYGTTYSGGNRGGGTIFAMNTNGTSYTNLFNYNFSVDPNSGGSPQAGMVLAGKTLYGTTWFGGAYNHGTITYVTTNGVTSGIFHHFTTPSGPNFNINGDGLFPSSKLIFSGGTLYGTAEGGGTSGRGTVFAVDTNNPNGFRVLHYFTATDQSTGTNTDGGNPFAGVVLSGNTLYGTTFDGGRYGNGTVYAVNTDGSGFTNLYSFSGTNGAYGPHSSLTLSGSTLYGTTSGGGLLGSLSSGTLFAINTNGSGYRNLYSFSGGSDGAAPQGELVLSGNTLYGTAAGGGDSGKGTVFSFALSQPVILTNPTLPPGGAFQFTFQSQSGSMHNVQYRTNLVAGLNWQTWSNVTGDGALKTIPIPLTIFNPAKQGFVRILTQ